MNSHGDTVAVWRRRSECTAYSRAHNPRLAHSHNLHSLSRIFTWIHWITAKSVSFNEFHPTNRGAEPILWPEGKQANMFSSRDWHSACAFENHSTNMYCFSVECKQVMTKTKPHSLSHGILQMVRISVVANGRVTIDQILHWIVWSATPSSSQPFVGYLQWKIAQTNNDCTFRQFYGIPHGVSDGVLLFGIFII